MNVNKLIYLTHPEGDVAFNRKEDFHPLPHLTYSRGCLERQEGIYLTHPEGDVTFNRKEDFPPPPTLHTVEGAWDGK